MAIEPPTGDGSVIKLLLDWAAWVVAALSGLLYAQGRAMAHQDKLAYEAKLAEFKEVLDRTISKDDFEKHEQREDKDRDERRAAEQSIREQLEVANFERRQSETALREQMQALAGGVDSKIGGLDTKLSGQLQTIIDNMLRDSGRRRAPRDD